MQRQITRRGFGAIGLGLGLAARGAAAGPVREELARLLPDFPAAGLDWLSEHYGNTAINVARAHGTRGAEVLVALGGEGLAVLRERRDTFEKLADQLGGEAAARFLVLNRRHVRELAEVGGLPDFLGRIEKLPPSLKQLGVRNPGMIPYLVMSPAVAGEALRRHPEACRLAFPGLDLSAGPAGLERVARLILEHGRLARTWAAARGLDGVLLLKDFAPFLGRPEPFDLPVLLAILSVNQADLAPLMADDRRESAWNALELLARWDSELPAPAPVGDGEGPPPPARGDLIRLACTDPRTIRWVLDHPDEEARQVAGATWGESIRSGVPLPSLLYGAYPGPARRCAWEALADPAHLGHAAETYQMLALMARWPGAEPATLHPRSAEFQRLLARLDARVVPYLAEAEVAGEPARGVRYERLAKGGTRELDDWTYPASFWVESIPLYDAYRLGWVLSQGYTPTQGEVLFACLDAGFTAWDLASLGGGKAATTAAREGLKAGDRLLARRTLDEVAREVAPRAVRQSVKDCDERVARGLAVRLARAPTAVRELARRDLFRDPAITAAQASRTAARLNVQLIIRPIGKYAIEEWSINVVTSATIRFLAEHAQQADYPVLAGTVKDALIFLNRPVGK